MQNISLHKISQITKGKLFGNKENIVSDIMTDSRSFLSSKKVIFFAIKGKRNNGHKFIKKLIENGIENFVISELSEDLKAIKNINYILVGNTLEALHKLADYHRNTFTSEIISIVGSNGKTIVKEWLYQLLRKNYKIVRSPKSFNSQLGVALSLCLLDNKFNLGIIEAGISEIGEMQNLEKIIKPNTVIFSSIGDAHQENFPDKETKINEKLKICKDANLLIYSPDYEGVQDAIKQRCKNNTELFMWSFNSKNADVFVKEVNKKDNFSEIKISYKSKNISYKIPFIDEASIKNSLSCLCYILQKNILSEEIIKRFSQLEAVEMRVEQKEGINNCILVNDFYNSDIVSLKIAIDLLKNISNSKKTTIILSDILQSGISDKELFSEVAELLKQNKIDKFIGIGNRISQYKNFFLSISELEFYNTTKDFLKQNLRTKFNNEVILLKAARFFKFEQISDKLEQKKHRTVLEINIEALVHNLNYYKSLILPNTKTMVMVKALSYGSGTYEIAKVLQHHGVDYLGVAIADEGVKLRKAGITTRIMVMNPDENSISDIVDYQLEPEIYSFKILNSFLKKIKDFSSKKLPVHIKIDTGMKRLGFCDYEIEKLANILKENNFIYAKSVFSHLVGTDEAIHDVFTKKQIAKFNNACKIFSKNLPYKFDRHILNSSGIERFPNAVFDMVRIGIGLYGFSPNNNDKLHNISTLKTRILQIKRVKKGECVGYSRKWIAKQDSTIAIIPIGYADGLSRQLSNGVGELIVNGQKAFIVGNICMDMCMIDITNINAKDDDEVIIFGDDYTANEIAKKLNTIPYEIITGISERVRRVYFG